jgi:hypothetical protein
VATVVVRSARPVPSGGWRLGTTIAQVDSSSRDNLVRYCFVVHPCVRLRESRLGAHEPASAPVVPISAVSPPPEADTPTGYSDEGRRMMSAETVQVAAEKSRELLEAVHRFARAR